MRNRSCSGTDSVYCYTFLCSVVCLSVVCHIRAPCLSRSMDLDAILQYTCRILWHTGGPWPIEEGKIWGGTISQNMQLQIAVKSSVTCYYLANTNKESEFRLLSNYVGACFALYVIASNWQSSTVFLTNVKTCFLLSSGRGHCRRYFVFNPLTYRRWAQRGPWTA